MLFLSATKVWEPDVEFWYFYFAGGESGDPSMTRNSDSHISYISQRFALKVGI